MVTVDSVSQPSRAKSSMALPLQPINTKDELTALPLRALVREVPSQPISVADTGRTWERRRAGWHQISGFTSESPRTTPTLPVRLLWHPKWREVLT